MGSNTSASKANAMINQSFEERSVAARAEQLGVGYIDIGLFPFNPDVLKIVDRDESMESQAMPFHQHGHALKLAVVDPEKKETQDLIQRLEKDKWEIFLFLCSANSLEKAFLLYESKFLNLKHIAREKHFAEQEQNLKDQEVDIEQLQKEIAHIPAKIALNKIEIAALRARASDIHIQPEESRIVVRFRIDGVLHDILELEEETAQKLILRIKYEGGMKSNITQKPQDGHAVLAVNDRKVDLRIGILPTPTLESIVIRILDAYKGVLDFEALGFSESMQKKMNQSLMFKNGLILITGPTGSGKTTTLYSMLASLNTPEKKIVTLEDPIEYHLPGVSQSQVNDEEEYTFDTGFKSLLRHDPDVILVGEIRTLSTAHMASEAALTGHMVLSSLHTNSSAGAITRLRNMGMENFNIAPVIGAIFAQRLVRKACPHCKQKIKIQDSPELTSQYELLKARYGSLSVPAEVIIPNGCVKCSGTGYKGQTVICEGFVVDQRIRQMILNGKSQDEIENELRNHHQFHSLLEDGLEKVADHITTLEEILRITN